jgi:TP901 family phage tail tape measure protein
MPPTAMTELAKGGLTVVDSMTAAKGTLLLAAAAGVDAATAAGIQANALNAFGLQAKDAAKVADILANTANAANGEITDFAFGMAQSAAVSHQFGLSLTDNR